MQREIVWMQSTVRELLMEFVGRSKVSMGETIEKIPIGLPKLFETVGNLSDVIANYYRRIVRRKKSYKYVNLKDKSSINRTWDKFLKSTYNVQGISLDTTPYICTCIRNKYIPYQSYLYVFILHLSWVVFDHYNREKLYFKWSTVCFKKNFRRHWI